MFAGMGVCMGGKILRIYLPQIMKTMKVESTCCNYLRSQPKSTVFRSSVPREDLKIVQYFCIIIC